MPVDRRIDKEVVVHIYNGILLSQKMNKLESVLVRWMNLGPVKQSEVRKRKTNSYNNTYIWNLEKWY